MSGVTARLAPRTDNESNTTLRIPKRNNNAAENGPTSPYNKIPIDATLEIAARLQPNSSWKGIIKTLGMERIPADTSKVTNVSRTIIQP
ncbi:hypothetical protein D3C85_1713810 [compost metagenome]